MKGDLPKGWTNAEISALTEPTRPRVDPQQNPDLPFIGMEQVESYTRRLLGTVRSSEMKSSAFHFQPNDVLYGRLRPYLNKVICPAFEGLCSSEFIVLPPSKTFAPKYLAYYLSTDSFVAFANHLNTGDRPRVNFDQIGVHGVPLPPLKEQRRIVALLDKVLTKVDEAQGRLNGIPVFLKRFRQSVLAAACSGRLTINWRENNPDIDPAALAIETLKRSSRGIHVRRGVPEDVSQSDLVASWELPDTWGVYSAAELLRIGAFVDLKDGNHGSNHPKVSEFSDTGLPFITAAQVDNYRIDYEGAYKLSGKPLERINVGFAKPGDVIYTHKGSVGRIAIADRDCVLTPQTTYYRISPAIFVNRYLMYYLASQPFSHQVDIIKEQTTRDFVPISEQYLLFHRVPPLAEQQEIARRVDQWFALADQIESRYKQAQQRVDRLSQAILAKAFRGELVATEAELAETQGRSFESADELLERLGRATPNRTLGKRRGKSRRAKKAFA